MSAHEEFDDEDGYEDGHEEEEEEEEEEKYLGPDAHKPIFAVGEIEKGEDEGVDAWRARVLRTTVFDAFNLALTEDILVNADTVQASLEKNLRMNPGDLDAGRVDLHGRICNLVLEFATERGKGNPR